MNNQRSSFFSLSLSLPSIFLGFIFGAVVCYFSVNYFISPAQHGQLEGAAKTEAPMATTSVVNEGQNSASASEKFTEEELLRAKDYYGKAFLLFLANVGVQLNQMQKQNFNQMLDDPEGWSKNYSEHIASNYRKKSTEVIVDLDAGKNGIGEAKKIHENKESKRLYKEENKKENNDDTKGMSEVMKGLRQRAKAYEIKKPLSYLEESGPAKDEEIPATKISGSYTGKINIMEGPNKDQAHLVEMTIDFTTDGSKLLDGHFFLQISNDSGPYSTTNGTGKNEDIRINPADPSRPIIQASPTSFFHFSNLKMELANFYDNGKYIGFATFMKK